MKRIHRSWLICLIGTFIMMATMGLQGNTVSAFLPYIVSSGYTEAQGSFILGLHNATYFLSVFLVTAFYKRLSLRAGLTVSCFMSAFSSLLFAFSGSFAMYCSASLIAGLCLGFGTMIPLSILMRNWFARRQGFAIGLCALGSSVAILLFPPIVTGIIEQYGIRTAFLCETVFASLIGVFAFWIIRGTPEEAGIEPYGEGIPLEEIKEKPKEGHDLPRRSYIVLLLANTLLGGVIGTYTNHFVIFFRDAGYAAERAALIYSCYGMFLALGKVMFGRIYDRFGGWLSSVLSYSMLVIGLVGSCLCRGAAFPAFVMAAVMGLGGPLSTVSSSIWAADFSSSARYAGTLKWLQFFYSLGTVAFAFLPGVIYPMTGTYRTVFAILAGMAFVSGSVVMYCYKAEKG